MFLSPLSKLLGKFISASGVLARKPGSAAAKRVGCFGSINTGGYHLIPAEGVLVAKIGPAGPKPYFTTVGAAGNSSSMKRVLSIQSHVVSGYVGNKCAVFPLQVLGFEVDFINSVQFSNHTGYGNWKGQVLTDSDLDELYEGLKMNELVSYTHILTGYVGSESFLHKIHDVITDIKERNPGTIYLCDPVLGDNGHFYVPESLIPIYQTQILPLADISTPNTFELEWLSGMKVKTEEDALNAMLKLHDMGVKIVVLSSLDGQGPNLNTYVSFKRLLDGKREVWKVTSSRLEGGFTGTGDLFAALFLGWWAKKGSVGVALEATLATMQTVLQRTRDAGIRDSLSSNKPRELQLVQSLDVISQPPEGTHKAVQLI